MQKTPPNQQLSDHPVLYWPGNFLRSKKSWPSVPVLQTMSFYVSLAIVCHRMDGSPVFQHPPLQLLFQLQYQTLYSLSNHVNPSFHSAQWHSLFRNIFLLLIVCSSQNCKVWIKEVWIFTIWKGEDHTEHIYFSVFLDDFTQHSCTAPPRWLPKLPLVIFTSLSITQMVLWIAKLPELLKGTWASSVVLNPILSTRCLKLYT